MALPQKEWRDYLDNVLDAYMRAHLTKDAMDHMVDQMEEIFSEHLHTVTEYSPNSVYPLSLDPLQAYLAHPEIRDVVSSLPLRNLGIEEKWVVKRDILDYIKSVLELSSMKSRRLEQKERALPSTRCWLFGDDPAISLAYMEPAVLTRVAKKQTPLQGDGNDWRRSAGVGVLDSNQQPRAVFSIAPTPLYRSANKQKGPCSSQQAPSLMTSLGISLERIPAQQEVLSNAEAEKLVIPKLSIPRAVKDEVWSCIKATPFSSSFKAHGVPADKLRSGRIMLDFEGQRASPVTGIPICMSPPLFSRVADRKSRGGTANRNPGLKRLGDILEPVTIAVETEQNEQEDMMETMRITEGWSTIPLDLRRLSTPPLTEDVSRGSNDVAAEEDENVLQIEELNLPSSPPFNNKELKQLFRDRMDEILLPRRDYPFHRRGAPQITVPNTGSFVSSIRETMQLPIEPANFETPDVSSGVAGATSRGVLDLGSDVGEALDGLCKCVKNLDKYSIFTKEQIEEKDGVLLPVPHLPPPNDALMLPKLAGLSCLDQPFDLSLLDDGPEMRDAAAKHAGSIRLVEPVKGVTGLTLELTWQPFVYRGPRISHETVCLVNRNPFDASQPAGKRVASEITALLQDSARLVLKMSTAAGDGNGGDLSDRLWGYGGEGVTEGEIHGDMKGNPWSDDGSLLLTRLERLRAKGIFPSPGLVRGKEGEFIGASLLYNNLFKERHSQGAAETEDIEDMHLGEFDNATVDDFRSHHPESQLRGTLQAPDGETQLRAESSMDVDEMAILESGSSHCPESGFGTTRTPGNYHFQQSQGREETEGMADCEMEFDEANAPPMLLVHHQLGQPLAGSPQFPKPPSSQHPIAFFNMGLLQNFLTHRGVISAQNASTSMEHSVGLEESSSTTEYPPQIQQLGHSTDPPAFPPEFLSRAITLPGDWLAPSRPHVYLASLPFVQRRALVRYLAEDCSVELSELENLHGPDLILDSHTAVKLVTISDVVPSNLDALCSSITNLGFNFTRIVVILEAYPFSRSIFSTQRLEGGGREGLRMLTETVVATCVRLKRKVVVGMGMLGGNGDLDEEEALDGVQVEFVLSGSVGETARLIRYSGDYAEHAVNEAERVQLWDHRPWLEVPDAPWGVSLLGQMPGMNVFAVLAIGSVMGLQDFLDLPSFDKLDKFGGLVGAARMHMFASGLTKRESITSIAY